MQNKLFLILILIIFSLSLRLCHLEKGWKTYHQYFFYKGLPLMTTMDAYYYLRLTSDFLSHKYTSKDELSPIGKRPYPIPLLVLLTAGLKQLSHLPLEKIAFFLPCVLSLLMIIPYLLWGECLGGSLTFFVAATLGMSSFYWYSRTCLGRFDTDSLIPFFVYIISFWVYKFTTEQKISKRLLFFTLSLIFSLCFYWWWAPGKYLIPFLLFVPYALSVFFCPSSKMERWLKYALFVLGVFCLIVTIFNLGSILPSPFDRFFQNASAFFAFIAKDKNTQFPSVSASISELYPPSWDFVFQKVCGHVLIFSLFLIGTVLLVRYKWRSFLFLIVPIGLSLLVFCGKRFLIYFIPLYALGVGFFFAFVYNWFRQKFPQIPPTMVNIFLVCLISGIVFLNAHKSISVTISPKVTSYEVNLTEYIPASRAVIWTWWDYGYLLQYYTKQPTIIDGGSQDPLRIFITAFPLTTNNPILARNWMRFFAAHGLNGFYKINTYFHNYSKTVKFFKTVFSTSDLNSLTQTYPFLQKKELRAYLFPKISVYIYLPLHLYNLSYWWYYFGSWDFEKKEGSHPKAYVLKPDSFYVDQTKGTIQVDHRSIPIKHLYFTEYHNGRLGIFKKIFYHDTHLNLFLKANGRDAYFFNETFANTLFMKLVLLQPNQTQGFKLLKYIPFYGGVWAVLP